MIPEPLTRFVVWGLFAALGVVLAGYVAWMVVTERRGEDDG